MARMITLKKRRLLIVVQFCVELWSFWTDVLQFVGSLCVGRDIYVSQKCRYQNVDAVHKPFSLLLIDFLVYRRVTRANTMSLIFNHYKDDQLVLTFFSNRALFTSFAPGALK